MNEQDQNKGSIIIGEGVVVSGSFTVPGKAVINGSLEGELRADDLLVGAKGRLVGNVRVRKADIYGETHDTLLASEHLLIRSTGKVTGKASYGQIEIERGGLVQGSIVPEGQSTEARVAAPPKAGIPTLSELGAPPVAQPGPTKA
jgi:cytoskeletal protein CcmA (bactofilin family)